MADPTYPSFPDGSPNADQAWNKLRRTFRRQLPRSLTNTQHSLQHMRRLRRKG